MPQKISSGLLMYKIKDGKLMFFLAHPGGPFWGKKDEGVWTIPKGEVNEGEQLLDAAVREFTEETGIVPEGPFLPLEHVRQKSGKIVHAWAFQGDWNGLLVKTSFFSMEWPPRSGQIKKFPEVDRIDFFTSEIAKKKILESQRDFITRLESILNN